MFAYLRNIRCTHGLFVVAVFPHFHLLQFCSSNTSLQTNTNIHDNGDSTQEFIYSFTKIGDNRIKRCELNLPDENLVVNLPKYLVNLLYGQIFLILIV